MTFVKTLAPVALLVAVCATPVQAEESGDHPLVARLSPALDESRTLALATDADRIGNESVDCFYADNAERSECKVEARRTR